MNKKDTYVRLKCSCGCSAVVVEKAEWENGEIDYDISIQDSRYDHNYTTLWGRIKTAAKILFGKPVYYSDVYIDKPEIYKKFVEDLGALCVEAGEQKIPSELSSVQLTENGYTPKFEAELLSASEESYTAVANGTARLYKNASELTADLDADEDLAASLREAKN